MMFLLFLPVAAFASCPQFDITTNTTIPYSWDDGNFTYGDTSFYFDCEDYVFANTTDEHFSISDIAWNANKSSGWLYLPTDSFFIEPTVAIVAGDGVIDGGSYPVTKNSQIPLFFSVNSGGVYSGNITISTPVSNHTVNYTLSVPDSAKPIIGYISYQKQVSVDDDIDISVFVSDDFQVDKVILDNKTMSYSSGVWKITLRPDSFGQKEFLVYANDTSGNYAEKLLSIDISPGGELHVSSPTMILKNSKDHHITLFESDSRLSFKAKITSINFTDVENRTYTPSVWFSIGDSVKYVGEGIWSDFSSDSLGVYVQSEFEGELSVVVDYDFPSTHLALNNRSVLSASIRNFTFLPNQTLTIGGRSAICEMINEESYECRSVFSSGTNIFDAGAFFTINDYYSEKELCNQRVTTVARESANKDSMIVVFVIMLVSMPLAGFAYWHLQHSGIRNRH